jgi:hypothetical protein
LHGLSQQRLSRQIHCRAAFVSELQALGALQDAFDVVAATGPAQLDGPLHTFQGVLA